MYQVRALEETPYNARYECSGYRMNLQNLETTRRTFCLHLPKESGRNSTQISVSGRDEYLPPFYEEAVDPHLQYIEIGPGLGYFMSHLVSMQDTAREQECTEPPIPIAIDMADFGIIRALLEYGMRFSESMGMHDFSHVFETRLDRCDLITNPDKVMLINSSLEDVYGTGELIGVADRVVDHCGPLFSAKVSEEDELIDVERSFLKEGGKHFFVGSKPPFYGSRPAFIGWTEP